MIDRIGQLFGNYRLTRLLGQGGFADVYLGEHVHLNTQAAIKVLRTQLTNNDLVYFRNEARTIAHLEHPHIVQVLDFGVEDSTPFLVMVYAPNGTLRQRYPRGIPLPGWCIVHYVKQIASALQYAHNQKLILRDIKPENMLLGRREEVLLSDFGIATIAHSTSSLSVSAHRTSGTLPYMAPEQIQGRPSLASDQYALGVVVYEWLCGKRPFEGSVSEVMVKHLGMPPLPLRERVPTIPADVEKVVLTALAKEPQQRFATVQAFATALEQAYQREPQSIMMPTSNYSSLTTIGASDDPHSEAMLYGSFGQMPLGSSVIAIGRTTSNQLVLDDLKVSSQHAKICPIGYGHSIMDLNSTNGTFVNEQWLAPGTVRQLNLGDTIRVGDTKMSYTAWSTTQRKVRITTGDSSQRGSSGSMGSVAPAITIAYPLLRVEISKKPKSARAVCGQDDLDQRACNRCTCR